MIFFEKWKKRNAFSLMEVNMAVFVMSIGILSMVVLYPLGLRESTQGQADMKQTMLADFLLNQAVAAASQTNITWAQWNTVPSGTDEPSKYITAASINGSSWPDFMKDEIDQPGWAKAPTFGNKQCRVACVRLPGFSGRIMGIMVQSTDLTALNAYNQYSNNPIYYAEAMFQGTVN
ncbi:MAG: hypothetical protein PF904_03465 [Kiritimatiellae bacterium]|jgi:hypothetical protein|nr:hypothetical protein [Kiritimatiellia bacterium]